MGCIYLPEGGSMGISWPGNYFTKYFSILTKNCTFKMDIITDRIKQ